MSKNSDKRRRSSWRAKNFGGAGQKWERCQPIFDKVKSELIETHYNWFVAVEPDSDEYFVDKDSSTASRQCREKHPGKIPHVFRINSTGVCGTI